MAIFSFILLAVELQADKLIIFNNTQINVNNTYRGPLVKTDLKVVDILENNVTTYDIALPLEIIKCVPVQIVLALLDTSKMTGFSQRSYLVIVLFAIETYWSTSHI
jgi:hypothetical protein